MERKEKAMAKVKVTGNKKRHEKGRCSRLFRFALLNLTALVFTGALMFPARGEAVKKISIKAGNEFRIGEPRTETDVTVEAETELVTVERVEIQNGLNQGEELPDVWDKADVPVVEVVLSLNPEDHFEVKASDISVTGAKYRWGRLEDEQTLILRLEFPSLRYQVSEIPAAGWASDHTASWEAAWNADHYELVLYRDGQRVGTSSETVRAAAYDFGRMMTKEGSYTYKVRAVNIWDEDVKSEWITSAGAAVIDAERAKALRREYDPAEPQGARGPGDPEMEKPSLYEGQYGWLLDDVGYWYRNSDGSYPRESWQQMDGKWYYFDSRGYMVTGWIHWNDKEYYCDPETGAMVTNTVVQDGSNRRVDSNGAWME